MTGYGNFATAVSAVKLGAVDYLAKPADADEVTDALLAPANEPLSPLMHGRSLSVQLAVIQVPFTPFKAAAKTVGGTLNDTYMAAIGGGVAAYHEAHNAPCEYLRVNMPVNMRTSSDDTAGNRWVPARFPMPIDSGDPATRIKRLAPLLMQARKEPALVVAEGMQQAHGPTHLGLQSFHLGQLALLDRQAEQRLRPLRTDD